MDNSSIIFTRAHRLITSQYDKLSRIENAYSGGAEYITLALIRHAAESLPEFEERKNRAYYVNHPRHISQLISRYLLSSEPDRPGADEAMIADWSRSGLRADEVMLQLNTIATLFGWGWLLVDYPSVNGDVSTSDKSKNNIRPYAMALKPFAVPDWSFGVDGKLDWAIVEECVTDKSDPFKLPVEIIRRRLWTRDSWYLFERNSTTGNVDLVNQSKHDLGVVPLIMMSEPDGYGIQANHWFEDVVRISDAILNAESEAQMNIIKQMFGLLVISEGFARDSQRTQVTTTDTTTESFGAVLARTSAIWETPEEKGTSRYISPDGAITNDIRAEIKELKQQLYDVVGLALQSSSKQAQTAESKAWDSHQIEQFLAARAVMLEQVEQQAWDIMALWDKSVKVPQVTYDRDFSVIDLSAAVAGLMDLSTFDAGEAYQKALNQTALQYLDKFGRIPPDDYQKILDEIKTSQAQKPLTLPAMKTNNNVNNINEDNNQ